MEIKVDHHSAASPKIKVLFLMSISFALLSSLYVHLVVVVLRPRWLKFMILNS